MANTNILPIILVDGKSKRFGRDKVFLSLKDRFVIRHTYLILEMVFKREPLFVGRESIPFPCRTVPDATKNIGPKGGLLTAFLNTNTDFVFLTACDMPFIKKELLAYMRDKLKEECKIYIPSDENRIYRAALCILQKESFAGTEKTVRIWKL